MENKYNWNLKDIYKTEEEVQDEKNLIQNKLKEIEKYKGNLSKSSENIYNCYKLYEEICEIYERLYGYGMLSYHLDMGDNKNIKLFKAVENIGTEIEKSTSFITPEITRIENKTINNFINEDNRLNRYKRILDDIMENKEHILSEKEENLLANFSDVFKTMENTFDILTNTEFDFGKIKDSNNTEVELTETNYSNFLKDKNERVRKDAFNLMYKKYKEFINTIGELYLNRVKENAITSKLRKYTSSLQRAVKNDDSTMKVYNSLVEAVNENLNANYEFMELKKRLLKKDDIHIYDIYVNPIEVEDDDISFEEASEQVITALSILGSEYTDILKNAFSNNWIDVHQKKNKRNGAYSMGIYGVHPFVLLNFINKKRDVSTIAHELGHAIHSYYSNLNQNVLDANYTIFVAEIASTVNEILLSNFQIENEINPTKKAEFIYELLEMIRATLFRQTMFAEFEKIVHEKIENEEMLSSDDLNKIYYDLNCKYFGSNVIVDEQIKYEWARIPHFYTPFYVYKYATGISAAIVIAKNIINKKEGYINKYIEMLKQGCTKKCVDLLKIVDVDLEDISTYKGAIDFFKENVEKLENLM